MIVANNDRKDSTQRAAVMRAAREQVEIMQDEIVRKYREGDMEKVELAQKRLMKSVAGRMVAFNQVITNPGKNTPGVDGIVFKLKDEEKVINQLGNLRTYKSKPIKRK